jgi:hypothetical protein
MWTQVAVDRTIKIPTTAAKPAELASVVAVVLLAAPEMQHFAPSWVASQVPSHIFLVLTISSSLHELGGVLSLLLDSLKPSFVSWHFVLQQTETSSALQVPPQ